MGTILFGFVYVTRKQEMVYFVVILFYCTRQLRQYSHSLGKGAVTDASAFVTSQFQDDALGGRTNLVYDLLSELGTLNLLKLKITSVANTSKPIH